MAILRLIHSYVGLLFAIFFANPFAVSAFSPRSQLRGHSFLEQGTRSAHLHRKAEVMQAPSNVVSGGSSYQNWFSRMSDSIGNFIASPFMLALAISVLWLNERRNARMQTLISKGRTDVVNAASDKLNPSNRNRLVHLQDGQLRAIGTLTESRFVAAGSKKPLEVSCALKLKSVLQVFQWVETRKEKKQKDTIGGGERTVVYYEYNTQWSESQNNSNSFHEPRGHENRFVAGAPGSSQSCVDKVEYGEGFVLPTELVSQLNEYVDASVAIGCASVFFNNHEFAKAKSQETDSEMPGKVGQFLTSWMSLLPGRLQGDTTGITVPTYHFYWREGHADYDGGDVPCVGDYRVAFRYVPDGPATVLALQAESDESNSSGRDSFLPYRVIERNCCGWTDEMEKEALYKEAKKTDEELEKQDRVCGGACMFCCCCCFLVNLCCTMFARPVIFNAFHGTKSVDECFKYLKQSNAFVSWGSRFIGWALMGAAIGMFLSPLQTFLDVIPIFGWLGNMAISVISSFVTLVLTVLIIAFAYLIYHPAIGITMMGAAVTLISIPFIINAYLLQHPP